jgi:hypothetical protein
LIDGLGFFLWWETASDEARERAGAARITSITVTNSLLEKERDVDGPELIVHDSGWLVLFASSKLPR